MKTESGAEPNRCERRSSGWTEVWIDQYQYDAAGTGSH